MNAARRGRGWIPAIATAVLAACGGASDSPDRRPGAAGSGGDAASLDRARTGADTDLLESRLRERLAAGGVVIARDGETILLTLPGYLTFESGAARVTPAFKALLADIAEVLAAVPDLMIDIVGHSDATGSETHNLRLSEARAGAVRDCLAAGGLPPDRMLARGVGEAMPVAGNETARGRARNRRVELALVPVRP